MIESIEKLRESLKACTSEAGVEPNRFDTYWITARACDMLIDEIEAEIAEKYMLIPRDADDRCIEVGDHMEHDGCRFVVNGITLWHNTWRVITDSERFDGGFDMRVARECRHVKPRTIEDVLRDVWKEALDYAKSDMWRNPDEVFAERADEIRELMEVRDGLSD